MSYFKVSVVLFAPLALAAFVWASEADEIRERAETMRRKAAELAERGNREEAENLERRANAMLEEAEQLTHKTRHRGDAEVMEMRERLEMLRIEARELDENGENQERLEDVRREAERIERELHERLRGARHEHENPHDEIARRVEHMRIAVDHLHQSGLHDIAEHVAERAEATERELHEQFRDHEDDPVHQVMRQLDELRHEIRRLREDFNELREDR